MNDVILILPSIFILAGWLYTVRVKEEAYETERDRWHTERQQLLDRIQAPSFADYKQAEVKVIKAQNGEKELPKLEQL